MRTLLAMLALVSISAIADPICNGFSPQPPECTITPPDTPRSVPEPEVLYLLGAAAFSCAVVRRLRRRK